MNDRNSGKRNERFAGSKVLITGGLGFIGSNLAIRLVGSGADVTLVDAMIPDYGGNLFNIESIKNTVTINFSDICDQHAMNWLVRGQDYVFHLAGQVCHVMSLSNPFPDIEYNIKGTAVIMEALRRYNPGARLVFTGTRGQYGPAVTLPVDEDAPTNPKGIYEISNLTAEKIIQVYNDVHGVRSTLLRLTNIYGPRAQMKHHRYGVANWFVRLALDDETISVFGDGSILRDFLYVDDCVDAIIQAAIHDGGVGEIFNVGIEHSMSIRELVESIVRIAGSGRWELTPFSDERKAQEPGDFYSDISKIRRILGWQPTTSIEEGLQFTIDYYRQYKSRYWSA
ncbi:NAD-dependent dehydratase [candidate division KSB3 bacterium]|uniref:NAD-dependent dehydratase n=1 Tax=candidate division KSB3 bacterium TaxID=2044937 RepID=A0A2G6KB15_9BACT|nr:MAG: NAD-dependent dehydratase [candidate division KSB3 bacterium]